MTQVIDWRTDAILRLPQVRQITGLSRSSIYAMQESHHFPQSLKLGARAVGWLESEVRAWLVSRAEDRGTIGIFPPAARENDSVRHGGRRAAY
jgi:prophage regulatory protein